ncbi:MAG: glycoside hydrolase family 28 protein [Bacteroidales bacterium]|nr:glycoside hydrolase family 28 protein [Bacteroidales bacterium]
MKKDYILLVLLLLSAAILNSQPIEFQELPFDMPPVTVPVFRPDTYNIVDYGAKPDGITLNTNAIASAIEACSHNGGGVVTVPSGIWLTGPVKLDNNINLYLEKGALLLFTRNIDDYPLIFATYEGSERARCTSPISGSNLENIAITGEGIIDGSGDAWRPVKKSKLTTRQWNELINSGGVINKEGNIWYPSEKSLRGNSLPHDEFQLRKSLQDYEDIKDALRPVLLSLVKCRNVLIDGPTFQNSPAWNLHSLMCESIVIRNVDVRNPWYAQNGDGLDLESCRYGRIENCRFDVGDDAICIKSGRDKAGRERGIPTECIVINDCIVYHGHGGFVIGSEMSGGVRNIYVSNCTFMGTDVGLRFKSTRGRGGMVDNIYATHINMTGIPAQAILFNLFYGGSAPIPDEEDKTPDNPVSVIPPVSEETPQFRNFFFTDITCTGAGQAVLMKGLPEMKISNIHLQDVRIVADKGIKCSDIEESNFKGLEIITKKGPVFDLYNCNSVVIDAVKYTDGTDVFANIGGSGSGNIQLVNINLSKSEKGVVTGDEVRPDALKQYEKSDW